MTARQALLERLEGSDKWEILVVGGGATGLGIAIDAAARGYRTLLLERGDFAQGTSSRSTKLIHGGVRYLQQGNVSLVLEALRERALLRQNAPHLVHDLAFLVPNYDWWEAPFYGVGLRLYDLLAGRHGFGRSHHLSRSETLERLPTLETEGLRGGIVYYDGQFDDAALAIDMARTAIDLGATILNYTEVTGLVLEDQWVRGVQARDAETGTAFELRSRVVINATGPFTDALRRFENPEAPTMIRPSQGVHIVLDRDFLRSDTAILVPHTDDGRVLFAIPWYDRVVVGTTDTPIDEPEIEPLPRAEEIDFLLAHAARYLTRDPEASDVLSCFAGIRPLVGSTEGDGDTAAISRDHTLHISTGGLLTVAGGKWTTYRKMAEDAVDQAAVLAELEDRPCVTRDLHLHGYHQAASRYEDLARYGSDAPAVLDLLRQKPAWQEPLSSRLPMRAGEVIWAVRHEMARSVADFLSRRSRALLLDARASIDMAPTVAALMAEELGRDDSWQEEQLRSFEQLAAGYLVR